MSPCSLSEELQEDLEPKVTKYLVQSGNCAQTSFVVLQEYFSLEGGEILKALTPFPGICLRGETCGAVVGSLMALGLVFGRDNLNDWSGYIRSLPPTRRFCRRFETEFGSTMCGDITEAKFGKRYDLADPTESAEWFAAGAIDTCGEVIKTAVCIAAEIMSSRVSPVES